MICWETPLRYLAACLFVHLLASAGSGQVNVLTYQYDNSRAGQNLRESVLTPANVNSAQFGKLFSHAVDGYVYGQPLYVANVSIPGKGVHNVVYVVTEHDSVYAFDADNSAGPNAAPLWHVSFLDAARGVTSVPFQDVACGQIVPEIGITSTPVIDPAAGTMYVVAMTREATPIEVQYVHRLHALDISSGAERAGSPVVVQAAVPGTADGGSVVTFQPKAYKQRPGLLLLNGTVYTAWSSHCDIGSYHGWLIGYDAGTLRQVAVYNNTPNGNEGSFWASGAAPAADSNGFIYMVAGNGTFDFAAGGLDLGESYTKLSTASGLAVKDYFTPFNVDQLNAGDVDVGSGGVALLPDEAGTAAHPHLLVGAGKEGRIYLLDRDRMGGFQPADSQIVQSIPGALPSGLWGNPAYFNRTVYFAGVSDSLKAFPITNGQLTQAPASESVAQFGYPGGVPTISANGASNGIVWLLETTPRLHAFDASDLAHELYNSDQAGGRDRLSSYVKFSVPTVTNGRVYAGTQDSLTVFGLLNSPRVVDLASGQEGEVAPGSIVSIEGQGLASSSASAQAVPLPGQLAGVSVLIDGVPAPLFFASPAQIIAQIPQELSQGNATVRIAPSGPSLATTIQAVSPGLFLVAPNRAAAANPDGTLNSPGNPARAGSFISAFLTGLGAADPPVPNGVAAQVNPLSFAREQVGATIGGQAAEVIFAELTPGFVGLFQVNVRIPQLAPGDYPLTVAAGGVSSNPGLVSVR
jgi:uncharacterized protein (TIGR03437 family)